MNDNIPDTDTDTDTDKKQVPGTNAPADASSEGPAARPRSVAASAKRLRGRTVLVTGAAQGIGLGIALRLAQDGANVALNVRTDDERARSARQEIEACGVRCEVLAADVSEVSAARSLIADALQHFGQLDLLVNNAGIEHHSDFLRVEEADYDRVLNVNLKGPFFLTQAFALALSKARRPGKIVNISSVHEDLPFPHFSAYCASKGGLKMLMRNIALELAPLGITVNNVAPGAIKTPINAKLLKDADALSKLTAQIPLGRMGMPQDVASVVAFLASDDANYITGTSIVVDGGLLWNYSEQ